VASIVHDSITASIDTVGELASSFAVNSLCLRPRAHQRPLIVPFRFSVKYIKHGSAALLSSVAIVTGSIGSNVFCHVAAFTILVQHLYLVSQTPVFLSSCYTVS
jgi:hypothetical protein